MTAGRIRLKGWASDENISPKIFFRLRVGYLLFMPFCRDCIGKMDARDVMKSFRLLCSLILLSPLCICCVM